MKKFIASLLCIAALALSFAVIAFAGNDLPFVPIESNKCGKDIKYTLNEDEGILSLEGSGDMYDYGGESYAPWYGKRAKVESVELEEGITSIGSSAFADCESLADILIPRSVAEIGSDAFSGCGELVIRGYKGSFAEEYALENDIEFESITVYGDAGFDGEITIRDAALILQFIAGWDVEIDTAAADADLSGEVTIRDAALILQFIAGWDVTLGE